LLRRKMKGAEVQELWVAIERDAALQSRSGYVLRRASIGCNVDFFLAVRCPDLQRALVLRVPADVLPEVRKLPETRGLEVSVERLHDDVAGTASIVVQLRAANFSEIFVSFSTILVNRVCAAMSPAHAAGELLAQLFQWQKFLDARSEGLGEEEQRGLYGELYILRRLVQMVGAASLAGGWVGPAGAAQDFRFGREVAIEVKTSIGSEPQAVKINGERQLDDRNLGRLYLVCLSIDRAAGSGETLPDLVAWIRDSLKNHPVELNDFEQSLLEFGYLKSHEARYRLQGFALRHERCFRVQEGFPRITEAGLPDGVGRVEYRVALAGCTQFAVPFEQIVTALVGTVGKRSGLEQ
jgi:hypothetical protein